MSRLVGVVSFTERDAANHLLPELASRMHAAQTWSSRKLNLLGCAISWHGDDENGTLQDDTLLIAVDGHIFNDDELKTGATTGTANIVAALYREHGFEETMRRLNCDAAIALYDKITETLWLGRDRVGARPVYYAQGKDVLAFGSRASALRAAPGVRPEVNRRFAALFAGAHYRFFDNRPEDSPYEGVSQLPAGSILRADASGVRLEKYWDLEDLPLFEEPREVLAEQYRDLLVAAVARRHRAFKNPAFTLSGGMDSSSVISSAVRVSGKKQHAFSSVYSDSTFDERDEIATILDDVAEEWHPIRVDEFDLMATLSGMIQANDEPVATATWLSHYLLAGQVSEMGFDALFGGLGGDELNAGEYEYFFYHFADLRQAGRLPELEGEIKAWVQHHDHPIHTKTRDVAFSVMDHVTDPDNPGIVRPDMDRMTRYYPAINRDFFDLASFEVIFDHPFKSWMRNRTYQDLRRETTPCCLRAEDRQTQAFGMINCDPFLDYRLIEFMFRVPGDMKIRDGVTKRLLREAMDGILPDETRNRIAKTGWNAPAHVWFSGGPNYEALRDTLASRAFRERGIYDLDAVDTLLDEHTRIVRSGAARENHMMFFWQLLNLEVWLSEMEAV